MTYCSSRIAAAACAVVTTTTLLACSPASEQNSAKQNDNGGSWQVENCGQSYNFDRVPERIVLQDPSAVQTLADLAMLDKVVAKAGFFPHEYFSDEINSRLDQIPSLSDRLNNTGHIQVSKEAIMAQRPDLIVGYSDTVNPQTSNDVPVISEPGFCGEIRDASWEDMDAHIDLYATIFHAQQRAEELKHTLTERVAKLDPGSGSGKKVAVVYPGVEGGTTYGYGVASMADPVVESLGMINVFKDVEERVFEISAEQLVAANPDVIVVLDSGEEDARNAVTHLPGANSITAVQDDRVLEMYLAFIEPASPLSVSGAEQLEAFLTGD